MWVTPAHGEGLVPPRYLLSASARSQRSALGWNRPMPVGMFEASYARRDVRGMNRPSRAKLRKSPPLASYCNGAPPHYASGHITVTTRGRGDAHPELFVARILSPRLITPAAKTHRR